MLMLKVFCAMLSPRINIVGVCSAYVYALKKAHHQRKRRALKKSFFVINHCSIGHARGGILNKLIFFIEDTDQRSLDQYKVDFDVYIFTL